MAIIDAHLAFEVDGTAVTYAYLQWDAASVVTVGGVEVLRERASRFGNKMVRTVSFKVGDKTVVIENRRYVIYAPLRPPKHLTVTIDGVRQDIQGTY
jgi:hypothetical protein